MWNPYYTPDLDISGVGQISAEEYTRSFYKSVLLFSYLNTNLRSQPVCKILAYQRYILK